MHAPSQGCFQSHMLLHRDVFYTETPLTEMLCTGMLSRTEKFLHAYFYREMILHWAILYTDAKTNRGAFTKECISRRSFYLWEFLHRHTTAWFPTAGTHMAQKNSANIRKITLSPQLLTFETHFVGQGLAQRKPTLQLDLNVWWSTFRTRGLRFVDINTCCLGALREVLEKSRL